MIHNRKSVRGMSLMEALMGLSIVGVTILASLTVVTGALTATRNNMDKQFATQKAIGMLEELRAVIQTSSGTTASILDSYDDGVTTKPVLTTQRVLVGTNWVTPAPDSALSGNQSMGSTWLYARRIIVQTLPGIQSANVRLVRVQVYKNMPGGSRIVAEVASVLNAAVTPFPPTQVYDVYALAIENVPGWWVYMSNLVPFMQQTISDLQSRNPGLQYRTHWITKLSYGRDQMYTPFINVANESRQNINWVYFYPDVMPSPTAAGIPAATPTNTFVGDNEYYVASNFAARMRTDSTPLIRNDYDGTVGSPTYNPAPYALADQYNNAMRLPDEQALFAARVAAGKEDPSTPTLRLLLEDMYTNPDNYRNAIIVNLHGELFPFPPIRNYSDAAKLPDEEPNVRVVTHPEQLRYPAGADIKLRVYSYVMNPPNGAPAPNQGFLDQPITITLRNLSWIPGLTDIKRIAGGLDLNADGLPDTYLQSNAPANFGVGNEMYYTVNTVTTAGVTDTVIKLYNSPLRAPCSPSPVSCTGGGLFHYDDDTTRRLYGLEYIPSPMEDFNVAPAVAGTPNPAFGIGLDTIGDMEKNTARWIITIPNSPSTQNRRLDIVTKIGDNPSAGTIYPAPNEPENVSTTYVWKGTDAWIFGAPAAGGNPATPGNLPWTERYQILGDPRHLPYSDLKRPFVGAGFGANENSLGYGFNPNFDDFEASTNSARMIDGPSVNGMGAEMIGDTEDVSFNITNANRSIPMVIDGTTVTAFNINTGGARTIDQVITDINANAGLSAVAIADRFGNRIRIRSRKGAANSSVSCNSGAANDACSELHFTPLGATFVDRPWVGWRYTVGAATYGVKNNGILDDEGWLADAGCTQGANTFNWDANCGTERRTETIEMDMNRIDQSLRAPMQRANALWTTMTGWSYYYVGVGGEIGYDSANGFANSIPVSAKPYDGTTGSGWEQTIISNGGATAGCSWGCGTKVIAEDTTRWWAMTWLGELYPDNRYDVGGTNDWLGSGNLPTGTGAGTFRRVMRSAVSSTLYSASNMAGTALTDGHRRNYGRGVQGFFWAGTTASTIQHQSWAMTDNSNRTTDGTEMGNRYAMPVPTTFPSARPFGLALGTNTTYGAAGTLPDDFLNGAYGQSNRVGRLATFFQFAPNTALDGSSLIADVDPSNTNNVMYVVGNGISPTGSTGTAFLSRWSLLTLIHSYFISGQYRFDGTNFFITGAPSSARVKQLPQVSITNPNLTTQLQNPSSINVTWAIAWNRWDGGPYTMTYNANALALDQAIPLQHRVLYSRNNGSTWLHALDDSPAQPGVRPAATYLQGGTTFSWDVSDVTNFPQGNYLIRVETFRQNLPLHYSYHQFRAFIDRS